MKDFNHLNCFSVKEDSMQKIVFVKNRLRRDGQFQFFMHQFVESAIKSGFPPQKEFYLSNRLLRFLLRYLIRIIPLGIKNRSKSKAILVTSRGDSLQFDAFPYYYNYEIIPMLWDVWPNTWDGLYKTLKKMNCAIVFVTVQSMAIKLSKDLGVKAYWIPEGIDINDYSKGEKLVCRKKDIYELGRQLSAYHQVLKKTLNERQLVGNEYNPDGTLAKLAYPTAKDLLNDLNKFKVIVSFPHIDTHPEHAGNIETLTQRYWEAILSGCLIMGRAPQELISLIGYNPVIDIDWENPSGQIRYVLEHISDFQLLVDRNYEVACKLASWDLRIKQIKNILLENGYLIK